MLCACKIDAFAEIRVKKADPGAVRLAEGWRCFFGWLAHIRGWGERTLRCELPPEQAGIAIALLLGESSAMASEDWEKYVRTGVIHALAISGQHLVVLGAFLWFLLRLFGVVRRRAAWVVAGVMFGYALLTGGRPSAMCAAVMVVAGIVICSTDSACEYFRARVACRAVDQSNGLVHGRLSAFVFVRGRADVGRLDSACASPLPYNS